MTGPAPAELWTFSGWIVLLAVVVGAAAIISLAIWWDNRLNSRDLIIVPRDYYSLPRTSPAPSGDDMPYVPQTLTGDMFHGIKVRKAPLTGAVSTPGDGQGKHRRPELVA